MADVDGSSGGLNRPLPLSRGANFFGGITHSTRVLIEVKSLHDATVEWFISWRLAPCTQAAPVVPSECLFTSVSSVHCHELAIYRVVRGRQKFLHPQAHQKVPPLFNGARGASRPYHDGCVLPHLVRI